MRRRTRFLEKTGLALLVLMILCVSGLYLKGPSESAYATLNYQDPVTLRFTLESETNLSLSSNTYSIGSLAPGTSANSNVVKATVTTNSGTGFSLRATVGSASNPSTELRLNGSDSTKKFECNTSLAADTWKFSTSTNETNWSGTGVHDYCLPVYTNTGTSILSSNTYVSTGEIYTRISAKASATKAQGTYSNVINFTVVPNSP